MTTLRKSWWSLALILPLAGFTAGCSSEEPAADVPVAPPGEVNPDPAAAIERDMPKTEAPPTTPAAEEKSAAPAAEEKPAEPPAEAPKLEAPAEEPKAEAPKAAAAVTLSEEEIAEIKKLPADEQAAALKQAVCPVSDEHLGSMGAPVKVLAEGKAVYVCCKGCTKDVEADPKAALAKLGLK